MNLKDLIKRIPLIFYINAQLKCFQLKLRLTILRHEYEKKALKIGYHYSVSNAIEQFKHRLLTINPGFIALPPGKLRIFWLGATESQDKSGFLQSLQRIAEVVIFHNLTGKYGIWTGDLADFKLASFERIRQENDKALLKQFREAHEDKGIDVFMGQMWADYLSADVLGEIRKLGVPIINIAMDDRLPNHWSWRGNVRLGSIGLLPNIDIALTTSDEACTWYGVEGCPALFWPLASDATLFGSASDLERDIDVLFIGNRYGARGAIINHLLRHGIKVECYGAGWPNGYVNAEMVFALSKRARIILGIGTVGHCSDVYTLKLRDFDAMMTGALYITHRNPDLCKLFQEGKEIEYYKTPREAVNKIQYFLNHPEQRKIIGRCGAEKALRYHTWDARIYTTFFALGLVSGVQESETKILL